jgi:hypothetical protein
MRLFRRKKQSGDASSAGEANGRELGVIFDIDDLGGGFYGWEAYKIFFASLDPQRLTGCTLLDGDTSETLAGQAREYCIAVQSLDPSKILYVKEALSTRTDQGLLPVERRFIEGDVTSRNPLALAGNIDAAGKLVVREGSMIGEGWTEGTTWTVVTR